MDSFFIVLSIALIIIFIFCYCLLKRFYVWIDKGEKGAKYYTRLMAWVVVISLGTAILMGASLLFNAYLLTGTQKALQVQAEGIAPIKPEIKIKVVDEDWNHFISDDDLMDIRRDNKGNYFPVKQRISLYARNHGQEGSGPLNFYLIDENHQFRASESGKNKPISSLDYIYVEFNLWHKECTAHDEEDYKEALKKCNPGLLEKGLLDMFLKVECHACMSEENPQCYKFKVCIYDIGTEQDENWCKSIWKKEYGYLDPIPCPKDSFFY